MQRPALDKAMMQDYNLSFLGIHVSRSGVVVALAGTALIPIILKPGEPFFLVPQTAKLNRWRELDFITCPWRKEIKTIWDLSGTQQMLSFSDHI